MEEVQAAGPVLETRAMIAHGTRPTRILRPLITDRRLLVLRLRLHHRHRRLLRPQSRRLQTVGGMKAFLARMKEGVQEADGDTETQARLRLRTRRHPGHLQVLLRRRHRLPRKVGETKDFPARTEVEAPPAEQVAATRGVKTQTSRLPLGQGSHRPSSGDVRTTRPVGERFPNEASLSCHLTAALGR